MPIAPRSEVVNLATNLLCLYATGMGIERKSCEGLLRFLGFLFGHAKV